MKSEVLRIGVVLSLLLLGCSSTEDLRRPKRIIGGGEMFKTEYPPPFQVLKYYIWYGYSDLCYQGIPRWKLWTKFQKWIEGIGCRERPENLICGGALITPKIVQTACHCLSYKTFQVVSALWSKAVKMVEFENKFTVYIGEVNVKFFDYGVKTQRFVVHQKCGKMRSPPFHYRYDVGWIILDKEIHNTPGLKNTHWGPVDIAGPYKYEEILATHNRAVGQRHVCLIVGFGNFQTAAVKSSTHLRYAWIQLLDDTHCKDAAWISYGHQFTLNYEESRTFACAVPLHGWSLLGGKHGVGDSGSPVTCNNNYFAVLSSEIYHKKLRAGIEYMMFEMGIRFTMEANAVEFRRAFQLDIIEIDAHRLHSTVSTPRSDLRRLNQVRKTRHFQHNSTPMGTPMRHLSNTKELRQLRTPVT